jgi:hypothetical protein
MRKQMTSEEKRGAVSAGPSPATAERMAYKAGDRFFIPLRSSRMAR